MNRIDKKFKDLKKEKRCGLITYIVAGDPNIKTTEILIKKLSFAGADIIELGIPFSDPIADGPTIQAASTRALHHHINLTEVFRMVARIRKTIATPIIYMTYFNIISSFGFDRFARASQKAGVDGIIIPDLPPEEAGELIRACTARAIDTIFLAAPTSTTERIKLIAAKSEGFIYYVSLLGVTGARRRLPNQIKEHIRQIRRFTKKPVCVGFGISTPQQVRFLSGSVDGVIVGSAVVKEIEKNLGKPNLADRVASFVKKLRKALTQ